jgi:hypothetical protein
MESQMAAANKDSMGVMDVEKLIPDAAARRSDAQRAVHGHEEQAHKPESAAASI